MSPEARRLLNPSFVANVIAACAEGFMHEGEDVLPILYCYLVPPFILHEPTRRKVPRMITSKLSEWVKDHAEETSVFPQHVAEFQHIVGRSILLGSHTSLLTVCDGKSIEPSEDFSYEKMATKFKASADMTDIFKKSYFLGRWLSVSGTVPTIFSILGVHLQNAHK